MFEGTRNCSSPQARKDSETRHEQWQVWVPKMWAPTKWWHMLRCLRQKRFEFRVSEIFSERFEFPTFWEHLWVKSKDHKSLFSTDNFGAVDGWWCRTKPRTWFLQFGGQHTETEAAWQGPRIGQWNINHLTDAKVEQISLVLSTCKNSDILFLIETFLEPLKPDSIYNIHGLRCWLS